tara:strand:- start:361 stop:1497 length:1137 start_codon:yes stop_codon:yes gene_type:complete
MKLVVPILVATACSALFPLPTLRAQDKPPAARQFLLDEYRTVIHANLKLWRDSGVWDEVSGGATKLMISLIEKEMAFSLDRLDSVTSVQEPLVKAGEEPAMHQMPLQITILQGNGDLGDPAGNDNERRYQEAKVGDYRLLLDQWSNNAVVQVSPQLRVYGPTEMLKSVLAGKPRTGLPSADVLSFTAGKQNLLAYMVADVKNHRQPRESIEAILPDAGWPEDDKPTHMCLRLLATGDEDDRHLMLELAVRHGKDGEGLVATEKAVTAAIKRLRELQEARIVRPLLKKIESERDGTDGVWRVDLGRARNAMSLLGTLAPFMMYTTGARVQQVQQGVMVVEEVVIEEAEEVAPKPKPVKKSGGKKKGQAKVVPVTTGGGN